jgi:predicted DCC family thiol-disulfide oxidoreductase YuxK
MLSTNQKRPLLIYDRDCKFCVYWVEYWKKLTADKVDYQPYQSVAQDFPQIPLENFQRAIQYVAPDGTISSAAKASFLTLSNAPGKRFWLTLYKRVPGFKFISETVYKLIASHRDWFYKPSLWIWGRNYEPPRYEFTSWLFLRLFGLIFLFASFSFATQALGLIGSQGMLPVQELKFSAYMQIGSLAYYVVPMVFWINGSDLAIQIVAWGSVVFSLLLTFNFIPCISLVMLYILYLTLSVAGLTFMSFQWDMLLLEISLISLFFWYSKSLTIWLLRWLLFRFIFVAGMVKYFTGDPSWPNLYALSYYFETEPLPTPLAWYAHHLPQGLLTGLTAASLIIEIFIPFLFFFPRRIRFMAAFTVLAMQIIISITGNYNFFNLTTMLICLPCFDDAALRTLFTKKWIPAFTPLLKKIKHNKFATGIVWIFVIVTVSSSIVQFTLRFGGSVPKPLIYGTEIIAPLRFVNTYGPFATITRKRIEIIVEGSDDGVTWKEYAFKYKPGDIYRRPLWNIPLQPRLDWQLWFAALSSAQDNPWFSRLMQRLLQNSAPVLDLLQSNPFPDHPPRYVRAEAYEYNFTTSDERKQTGAWWTRNLEGFYFPPASLK